MLCTGQIPGFGGRGVSPAYNVLAGETPTPQSIVKTWILTRAEYKANQSYWLIAFWRFCGVVFKGVR